MVPADCVHNPRALLRLRSAVGPVVGCNLDPSHLFVQGIDPIEVIRYLGDAIYHVHAKDARLDPINVRLNGLLDTQPYTDPRSRAWLYRTVGYGHGEDFWADFISSLRLVGYDDVVSIEHEDILLSPDEGIEKAVRFLDRVIVRESIV
jgi:sugar phosphate isomerase/epimerase